ncbi:fimbrial protein [Erwinia persicina]|uniref:fimbrial protein n=2 Tax=Erwinia persicina TaxID=55211 RepID=UPI00292A58DE|nr:fimbrial protein [Erwinia persicina]
MTKAGAMDTGMLCGRRPALYAVCLALACWGGGFPAMAQIATATVTVKVTVAAVPCEINHNDLIEVKFGNDVMTTRVGGDYKKMPIVYSVQCQGGTSNAVRMLIEGNGAAFDGDVLGTAKTDFGIALLNNGNRMPINTWLNFTYPDWPKLEAVPVKRPGASLTGGPFSAGATMKVEYR